LSPHFSPNEATPTLCRPSVDADLYADPAGGASGACTAGGAECSGRQIGLASSHLALGTVQQWADGDPVCVPLWAGGSIERVIAEVSDEPKQSRRLAATHQRDCAPHACTLEKTHAQNPHARCAHMHSYKEAKCLPAQTTTPTTTTMTTTAAAAATTTVLLPAFQPS
jgi:hypothetical protein